MRIYPSHLPVIDHEPQAEDFRVVQVDDLRGRGVLVLRPFRAGEVLFRMNGTLTDVMTQYSLQMASGLHLDDPDFAGRVLHSCDPNSRSQSTRKPKMSSAIHTWSGAKLRLSQAISAATSAAGRCR